MVVLDTAAPLHGEDHHTSSEFTLRKGETMSFTLTYCSSLEKPPKAISPMKAMYDTQAFWTRWLSPNTYRGDYVAAVSRSLMTLKALTYRPTGGIVAAATTSLPEKIGGARIGTIATAGCATRPSRCWCCCARDIVTRRWSGGAGLLRAVAGAPDQIQTIYGISGERTWSSGRADCCPAMSAATGAELATPRRASFTRCLCEGGSAWARNCRRQRTTSRFLPWMLRSRSPTICAMSGSFPTKGFGRSAAAQNILSTQGHGAGVAVDRAIQMAEQNAGNTTESRERECLSGCESLEEGRARHHKEVCRKV